MVEIHVFSRDNRKFMIFKFKEPTQEVLVYELSGKEKMDELKSFVEEKKLAGYSCAVDFGDKILVCSKKPIISED